jgi:hypothetical protein
VRSCVALLGIQTCKEIHQINSSGGFPILADHVLWTVAGASAM